MGSKNGPLNRLKSVTCEQTFTLSLEKSVSVNAYTQFHSKSASESVSLHHPLHANIKNIYMEIDFMTFYYHKYDVKLYIMYSASIFTQEIVTTKRALRQQFSYRNPK